MPFHKHLSLLSIYVSPYKRKMLMIALLIFINVGIKVINPQIIRYYLDSVQSVTDLSVITNAALLFIGMAIIQEIIYIVNVYFSVDLAWITTNNLRFDLFKHTSNLDMTFHNQYKPGEMIERVDGDVNALSNFLSVFSLMIISNVLLIGGILFAILRENLLIGGSFTLLVVISLFLMIKTRLFAINEWKETRQATSDLMGFIEERLGGVEDIKANAAEERVYQKYHEYAKYEYDMTNKSVLRSRITTVVTFFTIGMGMTLVYSLGIPQVQDRSLSLGSLYLYTYYFSLLLDPIFQILRQIQQLQQADASIDRVNELFALKSILVDEGKGGLVDGPAEVEFKNLSFAYNEADYVLKNINFKIGKSKSLGLIGKTGSGKTTISRLIFRLYNYEEGDILFNGKSSKNYKIEELRKDIEIVTQEVELFNASIRDNVTFFNKEIADGKILEVLDLVGLGEWIKEQPKNLDTKLTKSGLSAGQAQLLAFARAFIADPSVVILDEASSRLDPATESLIDKAMIKLLEGRTAIVIAHRLETLERVDDILLLGDGQVLEYGKQSDLRADPNSKFSKLLEIGLEEVLS